MESSNGGAAVGVASLASVGAGVALRVGVAGARVNVAGMTSAVGRGVGDWQAVKASASPINQSRFIIGDIHHEDH
jgi:hypothetical protein